MCEAAEANWRLLWYLGGPRLLAARLDVRLTAGESVRMLKDGDLDRLKMDRAPCPVCQWPMWEYDLALDAKQSSIFTFARCATTRKSGLFLGCALLAKARASRGLPSFPGLCITTQLG